MRLNFNLKEYKDLKVELKGRMRFGCVVIDIGIGRSLFCKDGG